MTSISVDQSYDFSRTELAAMSDNIAWLIQDIDKLDGHRRNMMEELKVLHDITLFYNERHPELHATGSMQQEKRRNSYDKQRFENGRSPRLSVIINFHVVHTYT